MHNISADKSKGQSTEPLRAIIEVIGGELSITPIADSDAEEREILDALRIHLDEQRR
jgi:hypothetical protein